MKNFIALLVAFCAFTLSANAQVKAPAPSPGCKTTQSVGLTDITLDYSRPSMKGRKIFGTLVPFNALWRTGANATTKVSFSEDVTIGGVAVPKGTYGLFTIPGEKEWTIILNKSTKASTNDYKQEEDVVRVKAMSINVSPKVESFSIGVDDITNVGANIVITWDNTAVKLPVDVQTDSKVMASIKSVMDGPSANDYQAAARYYYEEGKDIKQALNWINQSIEKGGEKYWILRLKSLIQAKAGDVAGAIATAERSLVLAKEGNNADYIKMNTDSIAEWKKK